MPLREKRLGTGREQGGGLVKWCVAVTDAPSSDRLAHRTELVCGARRLCETDSHRLAHRTELVCGAREKRMVRFSVVRTLQ